MSKIIKTGFFYSLFTFFSLTIFGMEKKEITYYDLPAEIRGKELTLALLGNTMPLTGLKTIKKMMLTSKNNKQILENYFLNNENIMDICLSLKIGGTNNIFRSLHFLKIVNLITRNQAKQKREQFIINFPLQFQRKKDDEQDFLKQIHKANVTEIQQYLNSGINVNIKNEYGNTPLIELALNNEHIEGNFVGFLNPKEVNDNSMIYQMLMARKEIKVNKVNNNENSALICAINNYQPELVKLLLKIPNLDVNSANKDGLTALMFEAGKSNYNDCENLRLLLNTPGIAVNAISRSNHTALDFARKHKNGGLIVNAGGKTYFELNDDSCSIL